MGTPDFILKLRERVGTMPLWLSGAQGVIYRTSDECVEVLLVQRADLGYWDHVAGIVEPGEHPEVTLVREAEEEAGVVIGVERLVWIKVKEPVIYPNGDVCQFLDHAYLASWLAGEARVGDDESLDVGWFARNTLPTPLGASTAELIELAFPEGQS